MFTIKVDLRHVNIRKNFLFLKSDRKSSDGIVTIYYDGEDPVITITRKKGGKDEQ